MCCDLRIVGLRGDTRGPAWLAESSLTVMEKNLILHELRKERITIFSNINLLDLGNSALKVMILNVGQIQHLIFSSLKKVGILLMTLLSTQ